MPATSIFISAPSTGMSGIGYSRISVRPGPVRTAARTFSMGEFPEEREILLDPQRLQPMHPRHVFQGLPHLLAQLARHVAEELLFVLVGEGCQRRHERASHGGQFDPVLAAI